MPPSKISEPFSAWSDTVRVPLLIRREVFVLVFSEPFTVKSAFENVTTALLILMSNAPSIVPFANDGTSAELRFTTEVSVRVCPSFTTSVPGAFRRSPLTFFLSSHETSTVNDLPSGIAQ